MTDLAKVAEIARWLEGLSGEDSKRVLIALVSHLLSSFRNQSQSIRWLTAFEKTARKWQAET